MCWCPPVAFAVYAFVLCLSTDFPSVKHIDVEVGTANFLIACSMPTVRVDELVACEISYLVCTLLVCTCA